MGKKLCFIIIGLILLSGIILFFFGQNDYTEALKNNWGINLLSPKTEIYYKEHNGSLGDGEYYAIFQYEESQKDDLLGTVNWISYKNNEFESNVQLILKILEVDEEYFPNFENEYLYYFKEKEDRSKIYIIWNKKEMLVYILEYIM